MSRPNLFDEDTLRHRARALIRQVRQAIELSTVDRPQRRAELPEEYRRRLAEGRGGEHVADVSETFLERAID